MLFIKKSGETVLEVMIAVAIMSIVMTGAFALFQQAIEVNVNIRNRVIALSIAQEGIEAVRSLRDVNWLRFSGNRRDNWLCLEISGNSCDSSMTGEGFYRVHYDDTEKEYLLEPITSPSDAKAFFEFDSSLSPGVDVFAEAELPNEVFELRRKYLVDGNGYHYVHAPESSGYPESLFSRQLYLAVKNPFEVNAATDAPNFCLDGEASCGAASLKIYSLVYWPEGGRAYNVQVETYLFDYFQRNKYGPEKR